jgi:5-formyltetrahydrofolate cyclo-ligase
MTAASQQSDKAAARLAAIHRRDGVATPDAGTRIAAHFMDTLAPQAGANVSAFWPMQGEIDLRPLLADLHNAGCRCLLPIVAAPSAPLEFRQWIPGMELIKSAFSVMEPGRHGGSQRPDIVIVPLLSFDDFGYRLGYGGGYYDRTLEALRADGLGPVTAAGAAFAGQRVDRCPRTAFDQRLDWIVTEDGARPFD